MMLSSPGKLPANSNLPELRACRPVRMFASHVTFVSMKITTCARRRGAYHPSALEHSHSAGAHNNYAAAFSTERGFLLFITCHTTITIPTILAHAHTHKHWRASSYGRRFVVVVFFLFTLLRLVLGLFAATYLAAPAVSAVVVIVSNAEGLFSIS